MIKFIFSIKIYQISLFFFNFNRLYFENYTPSTTVKTNAFFIFKLFMCIQIILTQHKQV